MVVKHIGGKMRAYKINKNIDAILIEDKQVSEFLKGSELNPSKRKSKLIHTRGFLHRFSAFIYAMHLLYELGLSVDDIYIVSDGRWWDVYITREAYEEIRNKTEERYR